MKDKLVNLMFPNRGVNRATEFTKQPEGTTPTGQNVRAFDALARRMRGGSRPGLTKYIQDQVDGTALIQHLGVIVDPTVAGTWPARILADDFDESVWNPGTEFTFDPLLGNDIRIGGSGYGSQLGATGSRQIRFVQFDRQSFGGTTGVRTITFDSNVTIAGFLLVATASFTNEGGGINSVGDNFGNTYTEIGTEIAGAELTSNTILRAWWARTASAGECTVSVDSDTRLTILIAEYSGTSLSPLDSTVANSADAASTWTTGSVPVNSSGAGVIGLVANLNVDLTDFQVASGITLRSSAAILLADKLGVSSTTTINGTITTPPKDYVAKGASLTKA